MQPLPNSTVDWCRFSEKLSRRLRSNFKNEFSHKSENDFSPELVAFREALSLFPVPISIIYIDCGKDPGMSLHTLVHLDLSKPKSTDAEFFGLAPVDKLDLSMVRDRFGIDV